jgi:O-antigen ligase/tetratricopeptide (TPR) repeat protein
MKKPISNERLQKPNTEFSLIHWFGLLSASLFFFIFPYHSALFNGLSIDFEGAIYESMLYTFVVLGIAAFFLFFNWKIDNMQAILSIFVLLLPTMYWFSSFQAVATHSAKFVTMIYFLYAAFFIFGLYWAHTTISRKVLEWVLVLSGYMIVVFGLLNLFGQVYYTDALWFTSGSYRLTSVFQYSNTYAGFLSAFLLVGLYYVTHAKRTFEICIHALMLVPIFISIMLTLSRGALVFFPLLIILVLLFLQTSRQLLYLINLIIVTILSFIILTKLSTITAQIALIVQPQNKQDPPSPISLWNSLSIDSWLLLIGASVVATALVLLLQKRAAAWIEKKMERFSNGKYAAIGLPILLVGIGIVLISLLLSSRSIVGLLPSNISDRLENINFNQHSVLERKTFYVDAMKVVKDYPLLGAGGGGWTSLYEEYQNNPYISRQAHSYLVQTLVEVGWIGFLLTAGFLAFCFYLYIRLYRKYPEKRGDHFVFFILSAAILTHSLIDFDMSFVYVGALVFVCLGAMLSSYKDVLHLPNLVNFTNKAWRFAYPSLLVVISVLLFGWTYREYAANQNYNRAIIQVLNEHKPLNEVLPVLDSAIRLSPSQPDYSLRKADWLTQAYQQSGNRSYLTGTTKVLQQIKNYDSYNRELILAQYRNLKDLGEYNNAVASLEEGIHKFQWDINFYEAAIVEHFLAGQRQRESDPAGATANWDRALELYKDVIRRGELLKALPAEQSQGRDFSITPFIRQAVGQIYYQLPDFQTTVSVLEPLKSEDLQDPYTRTGIRYYLAALAQTGQRDENLRKRLIETDPNEQIALEQLLQKQ